jgi:hypothetical protein
MVTWEECIKHACESVEYSHEDVKMWLEIAREVRIKETLDGDITDTLKEIAKEYK